MVSTVLTVYGHSYCSLCGVMIEALESLKESYGFTILWVDIEGQELLEQRFGDLVPVLMDGEMEICHYHLNRAALRQHFNRS